MSSYSGFRSVACRSVLRFASCERGAVTIDWVALGAAVLLLGVTLVYAIFNNGVATTSGSINGMLADAGSGVGTGAAPGPETFGSAGASSASNTGSDETGAKEPVSREEQ